MCKRVSFMMGKFIGNYFFVKPILLVVLPLFLISMITYHAYASTEEQQLSGIHFMQQINKNYGTEGDPLLLFSNSNLKGSHKGDLYIIYGKANIQGIITGDIYIYGAEVYLGENTLIWGDVKTFSSVVVRHPTTFIRGEIQPLIPSLHIFIQRTTGGALAEYTDTVPPLMVQMAKVFGHIILGILFLSIWKNTLEQGSIVLEYEWKNVIKKGSVVFLMQITLILIFVISVIGFPVAILVFMSTYIFVTIGHVSFAVWVGWKIETRLEVRWHTYIYFLVGSTVVHLINSIPIVGWVMSLIVVPIVGIGVLVQLFLNRWIYKRKYPIPFCRVPVEEAFHKKIVYDLITEGLKSGGD